MVVFFGFFGQKRFLLRIYFFCLNGKLFDVFSARKDDRRLPKSKIRAKFWPSEGLFDHFLCEKAFFFGL